MNWLETFRTGWDAIRSHRLRSGLTMLGILIGIAAVVLTVGLGLGSQQEVGARISSLGSNLLIVSPGSSTTTGGVRGGFGSASTLTISDADALASPVAAPDIKAVAPIKNTLVVADGRQHQLDDHRRRDVAVLARRPGQNPRGGPLPHRPGRRRRRRRHGARFRDRHRIVRLHRPRSAGP